jgi:CBS domain-containing protein
MISDRDIKKYVSPFAGASSATDRDKATLKIEVQKVMTKTLVTLKPDDKVKQAAEVMLQKHINGVPVVDADGKGVGIVTSTDLLRLLISML